MIKLTVFILVLFLNEKMMVEWAWLRKAEVAFLFNLGAFIVANIFAYSFVAYFFLFAEIWSRLTLLRSRSCVESTTVIFIYLLATSALVSA